MWCFHPLLANRYHNEKEFPTQVDIGIKTMLMNLLLNSEDGCMNHEIHLSGFSRGR
jgi:hypothetical protein